MSKHHSFKYEVSILCEGGHGGHGAITFTKDLTHSKGQPSGGNGGRGGDVYIIADRNEIDLSQSLFQYNHKGMNGKPGSVNRRHGASGEDILLKVPPRTRAFIKINNFLIGEVKFHGEKLLLVKGGEGGVGNAALHNTETYKRNIGYPGESIEIALHYTIETDFAIVGYTNAGKSLLFNDLIGHDKTEVGDYLYTTKNPSEGILKDENHISQIKLLDTPAFNLYEHNRYIRYIEGARYLLYVLDITDELGIEKFSDFRNIMLENSINIPIIVCINKIDCISDFDEKYSTLLLTLQNIGINTYCFVSAKTHTHMIDLSSLLRTLI